MKKRAISIIIALCLCVALLPLNVMAGTNGHTQAEALDWTLSMIGTAIDADGAFGVQCVDLIKLYYNYLGESLGSIGIAANLTYWDLPDGWNRYSNTMKPQTGDIVVFEATRKNPTGHVGIVTYVSDSGYNYVDYNSKGNNDPGEQQYNAIDDFSCVIRPDFYNPPPARTAENIGEDFTALITNTATGRNLEVSGYNVQISSDKTISSDFRQVWHFVRKSTGTYEIINESNGNCMDAENWGTTNGTNVQCVGKNDTTAQRWNVYKNGTSYNLSPMYCDLVMDWNSGATNVQLYANNNSTAQLFSINKTYYVFFDANGGTVDISKMAVIAGNAIGTLPVPKNADKEFMGWSTSRNSSSVINASTRINQETKLFAQWKESKSTTEVSKISLNQSSLSMKVGENATLTATVTPSNATDKTVTWSSDNTKVATVSGGKISAVAAGTATITARAGSKSATCKVTVAASAIAVTGITLSKPSLTLKTGESTTLTATVSPSNATDKTVTWSSSNTSVATVNNGKVTAVGTGNATITAKAGGQSATCAVNVTTSEVTISLEQTNLALKQGENATLRATVSGGNSSQIYSIEWDSSNPSVVSVGAEEVFTGQFSLNSATVTALSEGTATITAKVGGKTATCVVTVSKDAITVTSVTLSKTDLALKTGDSATLTATVAPSNATDKTVIWSSSDTNIATVDNGKVTAMKAGTVTITATAGGKTASCAVTVSEKPVAPQIGTETISSGTVGAAYRQTLNADGTAPITWRVSAGSLPSGLSLSTDGIISGTPTKAGIYNFSVTATNSTGNATSNYSLTVAEKQQPQQGDVHFERVTVYFQDQFTDVPANQWYTGSVAEAFELGLMVGNSNTTFNPYGDVTIAEAVTMASRIHSIYTTGSKAAADNADAPAGSAWYQSYLEYAYANGIINYAYYNSDATQKATRAQFAEIFANALPAEALAEINTVIDNAIPDVKITERYAEYVYRLYRAGILTGSDANGTFNPQTYITRAESAAIVSRMAESDNRVNISLTSISE